MYKSSKQRKQNIKVRARMPYLRGRMCRRDRGVCSSPRERGRRGQRRQNICNNLISSVLIKNNLISVAQKNVSQPAYSLQLLSYEAWKPRSLCFPTRHPSPCFSFFSLKSSSFQSFEPSASTPPSPPSLSLICVA